MVLDGAPWLLMKPVNIVLVVLAHVDDRTTWWHRHRVVKCITKGDGLNSCIELNRLIETGPKSDVTQSGGQDQGLVEHGSSLKSDCSLRQRNGFIGCVLTTRSKWRNTHSCALSFYTREIDIFSTIQQAHTATNSSWLRSVHFKCSLRTTPTMVHGDTFIQLTSIIGICFLLGIMTSQKEMMPLGASPDALIDIDPQFVLYCQQCMTQFTVDAPVFADIAKQRMNETFASAIFAAHKLNVNHSFTMDDGRQYMTRALVQKHKATFQVPLYDVLMEHIVVPDFADMVVSQISRYTVVTVENITFWFYLPASVGDDSMYLQIMSKAVQTVLFMQKVFDQKLNLRIHMLLVDKPKLYEKRYGPPGQPVMVNSGVTPDDDTIIIFRREEVLKVLVHELCHVLKVDARSQSWRISRALQKHLCNVEGSFNPTEAIAESVAQLLYSMLVAEWDQLSVQDVLQHQLDHGLMQSAKVLVLNKVFSVQALQTVPIMQNTYMLEYYVLRTAIMYRACASRQMFATLLNRSPFFDKVSDSAVADAVQCALLTEFTTSSSEFSVKLDATLQTPKFENMSLQMNHYA
jgi:hypothetical protein